LATKAAMVKLVNDARVMCNLWLAVKRKIDQEAHITIFSLEVSQKSISVLSTSWLVAS